MLSYFFWLLVGSACLSVGLPHLGFFFCLSCIIIFSAQRLLRPLYLFIHSHPSIFSIPLGTQSELASLSDSLSGSKARSALAPGGNLADSRRCPHQRSLVSPFKHWINHQSGPSRCSSSRGCYQSCLFKLPLASIELEQKKSIVFLSSSYLYHLSLVNCLPPYANASASEAPPTISFRGWVWSLDILVRREPKPPLPSLRPPRPPRLRGRPITPWSQHRPSEKPLSSLSSASSLCQSLPSVLRMHLATGRLSPPTRSSLCFTTTGNHQPQP